MEDRIWKRTSQLAAIVRDFAPSRLERQLLAQVFELAWNRAQAVEPPDTAGSARTNDRLDWRSTASQTVTSLAARR
jgi:hypothetical protein